jgi:hypothetical protein
LTTKSTLQQQAYVRSKHNNRSTGKRVGKRKREKGCGKRKKGGKRKRMRDEDGDKG